MQLAVKTLREKMMGKEGVLHCAEVYTRESYKHKYTKLGKFMFRCSGMQQPAKGNWLRRDGCDFYEWQLVCADSHKCPGGCEMDCKIRANRKRALGA